jgi:hypothetical protein
MELFFGHQTGFVSKEQRRLGNELVDFLRAERAARSYAASRDAVIEIEKHFAEIENDGARFSHVNVRVGAELFITPLTQFAAALKGATQR